MVASRPLAGRPAAWGHGLKDTPGSSGIPQRKDVLFDYKRAAGELIRDWRMARGLTQQEMADAVDMAQTMISAVENGRNQVPPERYRVFADTLKVPHKEFAIKMLRYSNPWLYDMLTGGGDKGLQWELEAIPTRTRK